MRCECSALKIDGKCPTCDSAKLRKPSLRVRKVEVTTRRRERAAAYIGLGLRNTNKGFKRFLEENNITEVKYKDDINLRRKRRRQQQA